MIPSYGLRNSISLNKNLKQRFFNKRISDFHRQKNCADTEHPRNSYRKKSPSSIVFIYVTSQKVPRVVTVFWQILAYFDGILNYWSVQIQVQLGNEYLFKAHNFKKNLICGLIKWSSCNLLTFL